MKKSLIPALLAGAMLALAPQAALAAKKDAAPAVGVMPVVYANLEMVLAKAAAQAVAATERQTYFKPQADAYQARMLQIQAQLKPLYDKAEKDSKLPAANTPAGQAALQQLVATIQQSEQAAQQSLIEIQRPVAYSEAYVNEQIEAKLDASVKAVMTTHGSAILLKPGSVYLIPNRAYDLTEEITAEVNKAIPTAQIVPPPGWEPRQIREARAAQAAEAGGQPVAAQPVVAQPAGPLPEGR